MQKLRFEKYRNNQDIISIDLHNGYTIIAIKIWNKPEGNYTVELHIKENTIDRWDLVDDADSLVFNEDFKTINTAILKKVVKLLNDGFFDYYINRYEYEIECFDIGNEIFDQKESE